MVEQFTQLSPQRIRANLAAIRAEIARAGAQAGRWSPAEAAARAAAEVRVLAAIKYVPAQELPALAQAGVELVGENRAQELQAKVAAHGELFRWDFIGQLQSRRVKLIVPHVRLIHSVASESALGALERHREQARPDLELLIEVNLAGDPGKAGVTPEQLDRFIERAPLPVVGLMTMPPLTRDPETSRRWFAALRELAAARGLGELSMGTTQDYAAAVAEGATIVRIGSRLYA
ncbi:MAG TPA: YggS family pyridoxal phosphate-dependent enzyme [Solirubrobacteraceae bacterium]|nr:YggS family pyridoxal phosphate-dependent enzyme [Solirubrobacteraceae bacterium]